ncbi:hypothetical protein AGMMS50293_19790 [Spirochaetia bacterium]|nr:hypothetical protein AGMMS50293_19790 [Spirochaetia bacterium]
MHIANTCVRGGEISGNLAKSTAIYAQGGGVYSGSTFTISGGEIKDNKLEFATYGNGSGVYVSSNAFTLSGSAKVTPKGGGSSYTTNADDRNSIYLSSTSYFIRIQGTLSEPTVGLIDLVSTWTITSPLLRSWDGTTASNFTNNAPTDKFGLGVKINEFSNVFSAITGPWSDSGNGRITGL